MATLAAIEVLKAGGSAIDAAIAANAALGFLEPTGNGIGGDLYALVWDPETQRVWGFNGSGRSAQAFSYADMSAALATRGVSAIPSFGALSVTVPGAVDGWFALHARFGRLPMRDVLAPAIALAEQGAPVAPTIAYYWARNGLRLEAEARAGRLEEFANARSLYWAGGAAPRDGEVFRNPDLARTYRTLARDGRDAFYKGALAKVMDAYFRRVGAPLRAADLAAHRGDWVEPVSATYRNVELFEIGENTQGVTALQMLKILEGFDLAAMGFLSTDSLHVQIEAKRLAWEDRARFSGDPGLRASPLPALLDPAYAAQRRSRISMDRAMTLATAQDGVRGADTTYLVAADRDGMMVSLIQSNFRGMGSGLVPDGLGFMVQNRGELFAMTPGSRNVYAPGKRPFQTIIPAFAKKDSQPWLAFGVMGGDMQPQGHVQIIVNMIDYGLDVQAAGDAARWRHEGGCEPTGDCVGGPGQIFLESGVDASTLRALTRRGHVVRDADGSFGGYQAIEWDPALKVYRAASEMRKDGLALGY
jgi:gamma-glutamyltranspeptidase/glutathione hydrolase